MSALVVIGTFCIRFVYMGGFLFNEIITLKKKKKTPVALSMVCMFLSLQILCIKHSRISPLLCLPKFFCQKVTTELNITQLSSNRYKTSVHNSCAILQCRNKWFADSPFNFHIQHQDRIIMPCILKLSEVSPTWWSK